jgi:hypothetical protein
VSATVYEPGYRRLQQNGRLLWRAAEHGVSPPNWQELELPSNICVVQAGRPDRITDEDEAELLARHQREMGEPSPITITNGEAWVSPDH